ncbi:MAG TPA: hypothetical protein VGX70_04680 [Gemmataceae bacterium]|nr:hypothetical protein [Gemmataceae bacterium]
MVPTLCLIGLAGLTGLAWSLSYLRRRGVIRWLIPYVSQAPKRWAIRRGQPVHLLLCIADHFEPELGNAPRDVRDARVDLWVRNYPRLFGHFHDSDGRPPRHTFFYPLEAYEPAYLDALSGLCVKGFGEVEVHLHHDGDCADALRARLLEYKRLLAERHRLLARHRETGDLAYGFIHGDWALDNSRPDGRCCGVKNELDVLRQTGCYADFTMPSAPDEPTQTRKINSIYYAWGDPEQPKAHDWGMDVGAGPAPDDALLLIQGPLLLDWRRRKWGCLPRIENGCLQGNQLPTIDRLKLWLRAHVQVPSRPDWFFVKLHTHGCNEFNQPVLLGEPMVRFHQILAEQARQNADFHFHYVTAREMFNLVKAAEAGWTGSVVDVLDYHYLWNGA